MIFKRNIYIFFKKTAVCAVIIIINSCINYKAVQFIKTIYISNYDKDKTVDGSVRSGFPNYHSQVNEDKKGYIADDKKSVNRIYLKRHFAESGSNAPIAKINNRGVDYALKGKFIDARFLFEEALKEDDKFAPAYNNMGIVFELFNMKDDAFRMYSKACIIDPDNEFYRSNFLNFRELK